MEERRKFSRLNLSVDVRWDKMTGGLEAASENKGAAKNISAGGICLILNDKVKVGDLLEMDIKLSKEKSVKAKGRVVWIEPYNIIGAENEMGYEGGIEFLDMSDETRNEINHWIFRAVGR